MTTKEILTPEKKEELETTARAYQTIIDTPVLERTNKIVEVGALTVTCSDDNSTVDNLTLKNATFPTQFSEKAVEKILKCEFISNSTGEVIEPIVFNIKEWYKQRLESIEMLLNL